MTPLRQEFIEDMQLRGLAAKTQTAHLNTGPYERSAERCGYANGCKPKTVTTRVGPVTLDIPQVREGGFYPQALENKLR